MRSSRGAKAAGLLWIGLTLLACSEESGGDAAAGGDGVPGCLAPPPPSSCDGLAPLPPEEACLARSRAGCDRMLRCGLASAEEIVRCKEDAARYCDPAALPAAIAAGTVTYDPAASACCALRLKDDAPCTNNLFWMLEESCLAAFEGHGESGAPCRLDVECRGGTCDIDDSCPGRCVETAEGGPCDSHGACGEGLTCVEDSFCSRPLELGADCSSDQDCALGAWCKPGPGGEAWVCSCPTSTGDPCSSKLDCSAGTHTCDEDAGRCVPRYGEGGPCFSLLECEGGLDCQGESFSPLAAGSCVPARSAGDPCDPEEYDCYWSLRCIPPGVCGFPPLLGESCDQNRNLCADGFYCNENHVCATELAAGVACSSSTFSCAGTCDPATHLCTESCRARF